MTSIETLNRIAEILERLAAGQQPSACDLSKAPLAESWSILAGQDMYRIGAVATIAPEMRPRPRIVPLLAIDVQKKWALVLVGNQVNWWVLGDPLLGMSASHDAEVVRLAIAWARRWLQ